MRIIRAILVAVAVTAVCLTVTTCSEAGDGGYNTDVIITDDATDPTEFVYFWINDASPSYHIDDGTYTDAATEYPGDLTWAEIWVGISFTTVQYAASPMPTQAFLDLWSGMTFTVYDQLVTGSVTVSRNMVTDVYVFNWSGQSADGDTISGSYTGQVDNWIDWSSASLGAPAPLGAAPGVAPGDKNRAFEGTWGNE